MINELQTFSKTQPNFLSDSTVSQSNKLDYFQKKYQPDLNNNINKEVIDLFNVNTLMKAFLRTMSKKTSKVFFLQKFITKK